MYAGVPIMNPALVKCSVPATRAMPKSMIFTAPVSVIIMLAGLRSRWTTPMLCACASAASACMQSSADRCGEQRAHAIDHVLERLAPHELHDHQPLAFVLEQLVNRRDPRMAEAGDRDRFRPKAFGNFRIVQFGIQNFDRHIAMKRLVQRPIDRAHAPAADPVQYPILADILPDHNGYIVAETTPGAVSTRNVKRHPTSSNL